MIRGITHDDVGQTIQRLAVSTKVAIGLPPDPSQGRKAPMKLDCFVFLKKSPTEQNKWEIDQKLTKAYGNKCKEFEIVLLDDDLENVFPTKLAWFTASECKCYGDGEQATRRTPEHPEGQPWAPCGKACPDFERGDCKPSGDLRFMLAAFPQLGAVARIHTSSYRSIMQISSSLQQIQTITGGRLAGIRAKLVVRPEKTSYQGKDGKRHSTTIYALNLEIQAAGIQELVTHMTDHARLFEHTKKLLGTGRIAVIEDDNERSNEIAPEFYPPVSAAKFPTQEEIEPEQIATPAKEANMAVMCASCSGVNGHEKDCKFAATPAVPSLIRKAVIIKGTESKVGKSKQKHLVISVLTDDKPEPWKIYCFHKTPQQYIETAQQGILELILDAKDEKQFYRVENIVELDGVPYKDNAPAPKQEVSATDLGFPKDDYEGPEKE